ncbi:MAG: HEXXH motif-containing putative peptide modification protein [Pseudonocardiales bacterium]
MAEFTQLTTYLAAQPGFEAFRTEAAATLDQLDGEPADTLFRRLGSPIFRGWLSTFANAEAFTPDNKVVCEQLTLWNNIRYGFLAPAQYRATMRVIDGMCVTWDPRLALRVGAEDTVRVEKEGERLIVRSVRGDVLIDADVNEERIAGGVFAEGCRLVYAPLLPDSQIVVRNDLPLLQLRLLGTQRDDAVSLGSFDHSPSSYPAFDPARYLEAATIIRDVWPEGYADFQQTLQVVIPRTSPPRWRARGMTISTFAGAIWLFVDRVVDLVEHMVHEQGHVKLRYIEDTCPILDPVQTEDRYTVGWRKDPRPIVGIYEGVFVHLQVLHALSAAVERGAFSAADLDACEQRIQAMTAQVEEGLTVLTAHGRFTPTGEAYLAWAESTLDRFRVSLV